MTNEEIFKAMKNGVPVRHSPLYNISSDEKPLYRRITGIILRPEREGIRVTVELEDPCGHSVSIADPETLSEVIKGA